MKLTEQVKHNLQRDSAHHVHLAASALIMPSLTPIPQQRWVISQIPIDDRGIFASNASEAILADK